MKVIINNKTAVLKQGFSFDYTVENRLFQGRDGYTLGLIFPMKGCPENKDIFGTITHVSVSKQCLTYPASIHSNGLSIYGRIAITNVTDSEVQAQFTQGRCSQVVTDPWEKTYINELKLGTWNAMLPSSVPPTTAWQALDTQSAVALPWINTNAPTAPNNWVDYVGDDDSFTWDREVYKLSWMPYMVKLAEKICTTVGYTYDFAPWYKSRFKHLICCNVLPAEWDKGNYNEALPKWTVTEFFEKLELLMGCEFDIDHNDKRVEMQFSKDAIAKYPVEVLTKVLNEYSTTVSSDSETNCSYLPHKGVKYADNGHQLWKYHSAEWALETNMMSRAYIYETLSDLIWANKKRVRNGRISWGPDFNRVLYAVAEDAHYVMRIIGRETLVIDGLDVDSPVYVLEPLNIFGNKTMKESDAASTIDFVPVPIDVTNSLEFDHGYMIHLSPNGNDGVTNSPQATALMQTIENGKTETHAYYDKIFVAFWSGTRPDPGQAVYPITASTNVLQDWSGIQRGAGETLRLNKIFEGVPRVKPGTKYTFSWLSSTIPSPRSIFSINGKRYICEKITATFTEQGMSQLLKGDFYEMV